MAAKMWGYFRTVALGLAALGPLLTASEARAQVAGSARLFLGVSFADEIRFEWGGEVSVVRAFGPSCSAPRAGVGPFMQLAVAGITRPHFTLGALGGFAARNVASGGQIGLTFKDPKRGAPVDLFTGLKLDFEDGALYAHQNWFAFEHAYGLGLTTGPFIDDWCPRAGVSASP